MQWSNEVNRTGFPPFYHQKSCLKCTRQVDSDIAAIIKQQPVSPIWSKNDTANNGASLTFTRPQLTTCQ